MKTLSPLALALRVILFNRFAGEIDLDKLSSDEQSCFLIHSDGTKGVVPTASVVMMGVV
jgi:hypothetical protein